MTDGVQVKRNCADSEPSLVTETLLRLLLRKNITTFTFCKTLKFSQINFLANTFLYIVSFNFLRQAIQKGSSLISELVHICFF